MGSKLKIEIQDTLLKKIKEKFLIKSSDEFMLRTHLLHPNTEIHARDLLWILSYIEKTYSISFAEDDFLNKDFYSIYNLSGLISNRIIASQAGTAS